MMLEIIMPHYDEAWPIVRPFFDMLRCQKGVDFSQLRVRIVHDGVPAFDDRLFDDMPFKTIQSVIKHGGVSAARNYGLKHAGGKWLCFCDADDTFSSIYSLRMIFDVLNTEKFDLLWTPFYVENATGGKLVINTNDRFNLVWVHGKFFRREFLKKTGMLFNEDLIFAEDTAFNAIVNLELNQDRIGIIKSPFPLYSWCWRSGSATTDKANELTHIEMKFNRNLYVLDEFRKRGYQHSNAMAARTFTDAYFDFNRPGVRIGAELEGRLLSFFEANRNDIASVEPDLLSQVYRASEKEAKQNGVYNDDMPSLNDWVEGMKGRCLKHG